MFSEEYIVDSDRFVCQDLFESSSRAEILLDFQELAQQVRLILEAQPMVVQVSLHM